ncbi:hypothetical protein C3Z06_23615 [Cupriavidus metallidurans]|nr:hypothetical protein C3Z06_23615 [Cupriavidus metallidurans]
MATLAEVIKKVTEESKKEIGRTKAQVLRTIADSDFGQKRCSQINSTDIVAYARSLAVQPQTAGNYMAHLSSVFSIARPAWGYPLSEQAMEDARKVLGKLGPKRSVPLARNTQLVHPARMAPQPIREDGVGVCFDEDVEFCCVIQFDSKNGATLPKGNVVLPYGIDYCCVRPLGGWQRPGSFPVLVCPWGGRGDRPGPSLAASSRISDFVVPAALGN